jgi:TPR repeat protein
MSKRPANINTGIAMPSSRSQASLNGPQIRQTPASTISGVSSNSIDPFARPLFTPHGAMMSPNLQSDVPPALSPLDAIAIQSRLLAKKFKEEADGGRRLSRLPPMTIANEFAKTRPGYYRSMTTGSHSLGSFMATTPVTTGSAPATTMTRPPGLQNEEADRRPSMQEQRQPYSPHTNSPQHLSAGRTRELQTVTDRPTSHYVQMGEAGNPADVSASTMGTYSQMNRGPSNMAPAHSHPQPNPYGYQQRPAQRGLDFNFPQPRQTPRVSTPVGGANTTYQVPRTHSPEEMYHTTQIENESPVRGRMAMGAGSKSSGNGPVFGSVGMPPSYRIGPSQGNFPQSYQHPAMRGNQPSPGYMGNTTIRPVMGSGSEQHSTHPVLERHMEAMNLINKPQPQFNPNQSHHTGRSPSLASEASLSSTPGRPFSNYSRPISRQSRPSLDSKLNGRDSPQNFKYGAGSLFREMHPPDLIYRQDSGDAHSNSFPNAVDTPQTPVSMESDIDPYVFPVREPKKELIPSYVYAKYPVGPREQRESVALEEFIQKQFAWDDPNTDLDIALPFEQQPYLFQSQPPSPTLMTFSEPRKPFMMFHKFGSTPSLLGSPRGSLDRPRRKLQKQRPGTSHTTGTTGTGMTSSTIKPAPRAFLAEQLAELTPEEHFERGIEFHEQDLLQKSTYHFRLASKGGNPTGMILYALACRHGWGMKPNAEEAVIWLRKAVEGAQLEVEEDEKAARHGGRPGGQDIKMHQSRFALGLYELGMSYMNGWGVKEERALALRCFEIAGNWGDMDALTEAARCYENGVGCKRNMRKAARLWRKGEERGVKIAGNSW